MDGIHGLDHTHVKEETSATRANREGPQSNFVENYSPTN